jgi:hypothetical protein
MQEEEEGERRQERGERRSCLLVSEERMLEEEEGERREERGERREERGERREERGERREERGEKRGSDGGERVMLACNTSLFPIRFSKNGICGICFHGHYLPFRRETKGDRQSGVPSQNSDLEGLLGSDKGKQKFKKTGLVGSGHLLRLVVLGGGGFSEFGHGLGLSQT